jgi:hypothetical protein
LSAVRQTKRRAESDRDVLSARLADVERGQADEKTGGAAHRSHPIAPVHGFVLRHHAGHSPLRLIEGVRQACSRASASMVGVP